VSTVRLDSGLTLSFRSQGDADAPAVVFLPGPTDSWRSYQGVLDAMPADLHTVAVSLRGHGDSAKPETGFSIEDLGSDVVPFLDALGLDRATLVGHSGSCLIARRIAVRAPARVSGLVLEASPSSLRNDPMLREFVDTVVSKLDGFIGDDEARAFVAGTASEGLPVDLVETLVAELQKVPARVWNEVFTSLLDEDDRAELSRIECPTLLVWGDADPLVPRSMQDELERLMPRSELRVYPGAGHTPRWEQPEQFADDVSTFARLSTRP
jgi:pimeloyl-ACP methyl ester carboxylesterase